MRFALWSKACSRTKPKKVTSRETAGRLQDSGIVLPPPAALAIDWPPRLLESGVAEPVDVPPHPSRIRGLSIAAASSASDRAVWNTLIAREHPRGLATFAGCQIRYLFGSEHGWLGAAGFSAAALRAGARDRWMAWRDEQRRSHLDRVVGLSRFLVRPSVRCPHLASHLLRRVLRRLPRDFEARYGFRPWLVESFVEPGYDGSCLRAVGSACRMSITRRPWSRARG